jgi:hypothetical protein
VLSFFSSRWNWDSPNPSPAGECDPPPFGSGGRGAHSLAREGVGESQFQRGAIHCGTLYIYVLWGSGERNVAHVVSSGSRDVVILWKECGNLYCLHN